MTKLSKKVMSLAIASFVTVSSLFSGNITSKAAETTSTTPKNTFTVHFKMPSSVKTTQNPLAYSYYTNPNVLVHDEKTGKDNPLLCREAWPGTNEMKKETSDGWYSTTVSTDIDYTHVIFIADYSKTGETYTDAIDGKEYPAYRVGYRAPAEYVQDATGKWVSQDGFKISSDVWFDPNTMTTPSTKNPGVSTPTATAKVTPTVTPTKAPTSTPKVTASAAPTAPATTGPAIVVPTTAPVNGPQVATNVKGGSVFYEEDSDYLNVSIALAEGATSATYSVDNGPEKTITSTTTVKVGQGKIANSAITLTVKSTDGKTVNTQTFTYYKATKVQQGNVSGNFVKVTKTVSSTMVKLFGAVSAAANSAEVDAPAANVDAATKEIPVHFKAPSDWPTTNDVYVYAYYTTDEAGAKKTQRPLDYWPGTKATKDANGYYSCNISSIKSEIASIKVIFTSVKGAVATTASPCEDGKGNIQPGEYYYKCDSTAQLPPEIVNDKKVENCGFDVSQETWFIGDKQTTVNPNPTVAPTATVAPTVAPTATPTTAPTAAPTLAAYFGAEKSAPQYKTTKQNISAVAVNATGAVEYIFIVDNKVIYQGANNSVNWDPSTLEAGTHTISAIVKDTKSAVTLTKTYDLENEAAVATPVVTATPTAIPTATPTSVPSAVPTATAVVATATPTAVPTATPTAVPTATPTAVPTATPTAIPTVVPTATTVPLPDPTDVPNAPVATATPAPLKGKITLPKAGKTAGETITIKAAGSKGTPKYKYTYYVYKGSKKTTLASKTTKTSVQWTPSTSGKYTIKVVIKDAAGKSYTVKKTYTVKARVITIKSFKTSKKSGQKVKTKITLTAKATTKKGKVSYKFAVQKGSGKIKTIKGYSKTAKKVWKPTKKGTYKLYVYVKNGKGVTVSKVKKFVIK